MKNKSIPAWKLERFLLGELPEREMSAIRRQARDCPEIARAIEALRQSDADLRRRLPSEEFVPRIEARLTQEQARDGRPEELRRTPKWKRLLWASPLLAAATILAVVIFREDPTTRPKGSGAVVATTPQILIYRKAGPSVETLKNGDRVASGDLLQIAYIPAGRSFGMIASVDGRGMVNLHFPDAPTSSAKLRPGSLVRLENSYELDDAPGYECFYFITSRAEFDVRGVLDRLAASARRTAYTPGMRLDLPPGLGQFIIFLKKGPRP